MKRPLQRLAALTAATTLLSLPIVGTSPVMVDAQEPTEPEVVVSGLNNPRQLSLTQDGVLLVAEAGKGGEDCSGEGQQQLCLGPSGAISAVFQPLDADDVNPVRVVTGLYSGAGPDGSFAVGPDGVSAQRFLGGKIYIQETSAPPELPGGVPEEQNGKLLSAKAGEDPVAVADITAYEAANDPDGHGFESNPYAVLDMGDHRIVLDAAGNSALKVTNDGTVSLFHVFPNIQTPECTTPNDEGWQGYDPTPEFPGCNFVPTSLALGPDSDIYVGGLASEIPGQGQVLRLDHATGEVKRTYSGFTGVTGVALDNQGSLYVSQLFAPPSGEGAMPGAVTRVMQDGHRETASIPFPAGLAIDQNRNVFVSAFSVATEEGMGAPGSSGQVWRLKFSNR